MRVSYACACARGGRGGAAAQAEALHYSLAACTDAVDLGTRSKIEHQLRKAAMAHIHSHTHASGARAQSEPRGGQNTRTFRERAEPLRAM